MNEYILLYVCIQSSIKTMVVHQSATTEMLKLGIINLFFYSHSDIELSSNIDDLYDGIYIKVIKVKNQGGWYHL